MGMAMDDLVDTRRKNALLQEELDRLRTENAALKERCEKAEDALGCQADLEKDFADARAENAALVAQLAEARVDLERANYLARRLDEARLQQPDWEKLWAEAIARAEQAEAQLAGARADYAAALAALELANMPKVEEAMFRAVELLAEANTRAERAEARIAELERDIAAKANNMRYMHDRFERAEAERDALREALEKIVAKCPKLAPVCLAAEALTALQTSQDK